MSHDRAYLWLLGPGRQPLEATGWRSGGECHPGYYERHQGNRRNELEEAISESCEVKTLPDTIQQSTHRRGSTTVGSKLNLDKWAPGSQKTVQTGSTSVSDATTHSLGGQAIGNGGCSASL